VIEIAFTRVAPQPEIVFGDVAAEQITLTRVDAQPGIEFADGSDSFVVELAEYLVGPPGRDGNPGAPGTTTWEGITDKPAIPSKVSELENDSGFLTPASIPPDIATTDDVAAEAAARAAADADTFASAKTYADGKVSGLGTASTHAAEDFDPAGAAAAARAAAEVYADGKAAAITPDSLSVYTRDEVDTKDGVIAAAASAAAAAAQSAAETYADGKDATNLAAAKAYTDAAAGAIPKNVTDGGGYTRALVDSKDADTLGYAEAYTDTKIAALIGSAPGTLDTLGEIAAAIAADETGASAMAAQIALKASEADLLTHEADHSNPHAVTADQVGAYTEAQTDAKDAATLAAANAHADAEVGALVIPHVAGDVGAYTQAQTDAKDAAALASAEAYAAAQDAIELAAAKAYAAAQDAIQLAAAKAYADAQDVIQLAAAKAFATAADAAVLTSAEAYTYSQIQIDDKVTGVLPPAAPDGAALTAHGGAWIANAFFGPIQSWPALV
jgi:hypothetical protein